MVADFGSTILYFVLVFDVDCFVLCYCVVFSAPLFLYEASLEYNGSFYSEVQETIDRLTEQKIVNKENTGPYNVIFSLSQSPARPLFYFYFKIAEEFPKRVIKQRIILAHDLAVCK